ncbi:MAG: type III secretion system protein [Proteobacteria bacterium]|nr:MAG: type III secretion system protein [Pseudomonadota bacterium]
MSNESSSEKTEQATPRKLEKAREKGQVASSKDIPSALILLVACIYFWVMGDWLLGKLAELFIVIPQLQNKPFNQALSESIDISMQIGFATIVLPFVIMSALTGILTNIIQFGVIFAIDPIIPRFSKINPTDGFKRIFSMKQVVNTLLSLLKTIAIAAAMAIILYLGFGDLLHEIKQCDVLCQETLIANMLNKMMMMILPLIIFLAVLDYLFQRFQFQKDQRMTKDEVKREMKDIFGDPEVRGARQGMRRELAEQDIQSRIKTARLVIIDIGVAVALHYEQGVTPLPLIVAIGKAGMARKMVEIAQIEHVPIISDARLTADMVENGKIDQYIPTSTIDRVAQAMRKTSKQ